MNLSKPLKVTVIPERVPARQPAPPPRHAPEPLIPLPADWPIRTGQPARPPKEVGKASR